MIIVEASVAVKWVVSEFAAPRRRHSSTAIDWARPHLWLSEASNALWAKVMRQQLTAEEVRGQADLANAPIVPIPLPGLLPLAIRLALELAHPDLRLLYLPQPYRKTLVW